MERRANLCGPPPDVTVLIVTKETDVIDVLKCSREMVVRNVPLVTKEMNATDVLMVTMVILVVINKITRNKLLTQI